MYLIAVDDIVCVSLCVFEISMATFWCIFYVPMNVNYVSVCICVRSHVIFLYIVWFMYLRVCFVSFL